jgi:hypothetical protein
MDKIQELLDKIKEQLPDLNEKEQYLFIKNCVENELLYLNQEPKEE